MMDKKQNNHKMIFLIAPPRSLSTAFLRMMATRQDFMIYNEPVSHIYNKKHYPHSEGFYTAHQNTYNEVKKRLYASMTHHHVFVKEMSFAFEEFINSEPELLDNKNVFFVFLLRNPQHCLISYYKKIPADYLEFMVPNLAKLTGYQALYKSFEMIQTCASNKPHIIHAEQLINDTVNTIQSFCQHVEIPFKKEYLQWNSLGDDFTGRQEWQENKKTESIYHWHQEAIQSRGFHLPTSYAVDENNHPLFSEIENRDHKKICMKVYQENKAFYHLISAR